MTRGVTRDADVRGDRGYGGVLYRFRQPFGEPAYHVGILFMRRKNQAVSLFVLELHIERHDEVMSPYFILYVDARHEADAESRACGLDDHAVEIEMHCQGRMTVTLSREREPMLPCVGAGRFVQ